jgi:hypothetical protein
MSNNGAYTASGYNGPDARGPRDSNGHRAQDTNGGGPPGSNVVTIRAAGAADREALRRLAERDSARPIGEPVLVAQVDGELRAAVSARTGDAVADPFYPTAELVDMLRVHTRLA